MTGEICHMVKGRCGVMPHHVMRWQDENWGPCDPMEVPNGINCVFRGISYCTMVVFVLNSLPPSIATTPRPCSCSVALRRSRNGTTHSHNHEKNSLDELTDQKAVGNFMAAHPPLVAHHNGTIAPAGANWTGTQPFHARFAAQPLLGQHDWVDLAPMGQGICRTGDTGISQSTVNHFNACQVASAGGVAPAASNLHQNRTANQVRQGLFGMPGTPR